MLTLPKDKLGQTRKGKGKQWGKAVVTLAPRREKLLTASGQGFPPCEKKIG